MLQRFGRCTAHIRTYLVFEQRFVTYPELRSIPILRKVVHGEFGMLVFCCCFQFCKALLLYILFAVEVFQDSQCIGRQCSMNVNTWSDRVILFTNGISSSSLAILSARSRELLQPRWFADLPRSTCNGAQSYGRYVVISHKVNTAGLRRSRQLLSLVHNFTETARR
jgi:hypothetical protein